jgi:hypothetical protein
MMGNPGEFRPYMTLLAAERWDRDRGHSQQRQPLSELRKGQTSIRVRVHGFKHLGTGGTGETWELGNLG